MLGYGWILAEYSGSSQLAQLIHDDALRPSGVRPPSLTHGGGDRMGKGLAAAACPHGRLSQGACVYFEPPDAVPGPRRPLPQ